MTGAAGVPTLYDLLSSGNGRKRRLLLHQPAIPYRRVELDILKGGTRAPERARLAGARGQAAAAARSDRRGGLSAAPARR